MKSLVLSAASILLASGTAFAQGFNIDFGSVITRPSNAYPAASGQAGCWTRVNAGAATFLNDLPMCAMTGVWINGTGGVNGNFNHPATGGNHQRMYDDWVNLGPPGTLRQYFVNNLAAGWYGVYTYTWGSNPGIWSGVFVNVLGSIDPPVLVQDNGNWNAAVGHVLWQHFAYHEVFVGGGPITIDLLVDPATPGNGRLNAIQIVPIAGPGNGDGVPPNYDNPDG